MQALVRINPVDFLRHSNNRQRKSQPHGADFHTIDALNHPIAGGGSDSDWVNLACVAKEENNAYKALESGTVKPSAN